MVTLKRTNAKNSDFIELVALLNNYLAVIDGDEHEFYNSHNSIENLNHVIVAYKNNQPVGCGAFKLYGTDSGEIKRMYVLEEARGLKIASQILSGLEAWAKEENLRSFILETGARMPDAISFYKNCGYERIANYGQYREMDNSRCFEKLL